MPRRRSLLALGGVLVLFGAGACGARSEIPGEVGSSAGGAAPSASSSTSMVGTGSGATGGSGPLCEDFLPSGPILISPSPAHAAELSATPDGFAALSLIEAPAATDGPLQLFITDAFGDWPPVLAASTQIAVSARDQAMGPGAGGPVAGVVTPGGAFLFPSLVGMTSGQPLMPTDRPLFALGVGNRTFVGGASDQPDGQVITDTSYQIGGLVNEEEPLVCVSYAGFQSAIRLDDGFLTAISTPNAVDDQACTVPASTPGRVIALERYQSQNGSGSFMVRTHGDFITSGEPLAGLALAKAPFGAWVVWQTDGSTSEAPPTIQAQQVDSNGKIFSGAVSFNYDEGNPQLVPMQKESSFVCTALGDDLACAWPNLSDPNDPVIGVQLAHPDGSLGVIVTLHTAAAPFFGRLRIIAAANSGQLLFSWDSGSGGSQVALARLDCVQLE